MKITFTKSSEKELLGVERKLGQRIFRKISTLATNPYQTGSVKLKGSESYRIRIGDFRVVYAIDKENKEVTIIKVGHLKEVYR